MVRASLPSVLGSTTARSLTFYLFELMRLLIQQAFLVDGDFVTLTTVPPVTNATTSVTSVTPELTLVLMSPLTGILGFERNAVASTMALKQAQNDGMLPGITVR